MINKKKIHFFTKGDIDLGSSRQRVYLVSYYLTQKGWSTKIHRPSLEELSRARWPRKFFLIMRLFKKIKEIKKEDIVFVHKGIYNKYFLFFLLFVKFFLKRTVVSDFDDATFIHSPFKTKLITRLSDCVFVGSHYLYSWFQKYNSKVELVPTSLDYKVYNKFSAKYQNKIPVIGWIGNGPAHYINLRHLPDIFIELLKKRNKFHFILLGAVGDKRIYDLFNIPGLSKEIIDSVRWSDPAQVASVIQNFDIGIMPLEDIEIEKGKCAFKAIEYMACGVATVASEVGENKYLIQNYHNGILVKRWGEWPQFLEELLNNKSLRIKLGKKGQETIRVKYSIENNIKKIEKILFSL